MTYDKDQIEALPLLLKFAAEQPGAPKELLLEAKDQVEWLRKRVEFLEGLLVGLGQSTE